jgi:hypothetical protein
VTYSAQAPKREYRKDQGSEYSSTRPSLHDADNTKGNKDGSGSQTDGKNVPSVPVVAKDSTTDSPAASTHSLIICVTPTQESPTTTNSHAKNYLSCMRTPTTPQQDRHSRQHRSHTRDGNFSFAGTPENSHSPPRLFPPGQVPTKKGTNFSLPTRKSGLTSCPSVAPESEEFRTTRVHPRKTVNVKVTER